jgi:methyl-accepting chemotaxis protein
MKKMTLGKKIGLGFGALILIAAILGGMSTINLKTVQGDANVMAAQYVPESRIAGDLQDAFAKMNLNIRTYGLTADATYLEKARESGKAAHQQMQLARNLSDAHPELVKLAANIKEIEPLFSSYEDLISQTESKNRDILESREKLNKAASDFIANIDKLIAGQKAKLASEIKAFAEAGKLQERADKLALANEIRGEGNAARIAVFKSQALRAPELIQEGLKGFDLMDSKFAELQSKLVAAEDIAELNNVKNDAHAYRDAMKGIMDDYVALGAIGDKRVAAVEHIDLLVGDTQATGMKRTVEAADASSQKIAGVSHMTIVGLVVSLVVGVVVAFYIIGNTTKVLSTVAGALEEGSNQVASAAGQVSSASQSLAEGASEQAASLEESGSSLEEMASMTASNSENALKANDLAKQTREAADKGVNDMQTMSAAMEAIKESSGDIAKIIKTIDEIAFQTNILALNAAVEAARAGEAGMGFAVVADEVRNLAQRSAQAAKETAEKIQGAITKTGQGVEISSKVSQTLNDIVTRVRQLDELVDGVANASREQTQGIAQINIAVGQMDKVTQSNAANAEESAAAAEELNAQAMVMRQSVAEMLEMVGGAKRTEEAKPSAPVPRRKSVQAASQSFEKTAPAKAKTNGNGHSHSKHELASVGKSRGEIPMDDDFKNF